MSATVGDIQAIIEEWAPPSWAEPWDRVGLQVGDPAAPAGRVLVALEVTDAVLDEAVSAEAGLLVVHHPFIFKPLAEVRLDRPAGRWLRRLLQAGIGVYAAHTNLDVAPGGTNDLLAERVGLTGAEVLQPLGQERLMKLATFVPATHADAVREALAAAGAGIIGHYSHCTFELPGTGTFKPLHGARPYLGQVGELERAAEVRLETLVPEARVRDAVQAMRAAHPYEEVAYDLYPLANPGPVRGHGRVGRLERPAALGELARRVRDGLGAAALRMAGDPAAMVERVAVGAGSGGSLVPLALQSGAQVLVAGDIDHHEARDALDAGMAVIDPGHYASEQPVVAALVRRISDGLAARGRQALVAAARGQEPFVLPG